MKTRRLTGSPVVAVMGNKLHSRVFSNNMCILKLKQSTETSLSDLLNRRWALDNPESKINKISLLEKKGQLKKASSLAIGFSNNTTPSLGDHMVEKRKQGLSFYVVRDDLLHPLINGNKARKLDGLLPLVQDHWVSDLVTCGGCQSAHAAAVERGVRSHLLLRGEKPEIPTGYNLISSMYGNVTYIERSLYARRKEMLRRYAELVAGNSGSVMWLSDILETSFAAQKSGKQILQGDYYGSSITQIEAANSPKRVVIVNEGAGDTVGLFGIIRLTKYLSQNHLFGKGRPLKIVVDAGTGTTAIGLGLGALSLRLPWEIHAVMLADTLDGYKKQEERLIFGFKRLYEFEIFDNKLNAGNDGIVNWVDRVRPRKFGNVLKGEVEACQHIAQQTGILVDPVYTLAAWEHAILLCQKGTEEDAEVVMLHTGGTLGMFGLAQRYKSYFNSLEQFVGTQLH